MNTRAMRELLLESLYVASFLLLVGCAPGLDGVRQGLTTAAVATASGYRTLGRIDEAKQAEIRSIAKIDPAKARAALEAHNAKYDLARKVLDVSTEALVVAENNAEEIDHNLRSKAEIPALISTIVKIGLDIKTALNNLEVF